MTDLGRLVRDARLRSGISQRQLAIRAGTSQAAISRIERGLEEPRFDRFATIMTGLGYASRVELRPLADDDETPGEPSPRAPEGGPWRMNEVVRRRRLREAATRPLGANFREGIALSEFGIRFKGAAIRRR